MKYLYALFYLFVGIMCCACGVDLPENTYEEDTMEQFPPQTEYTLEELTDQTANFRDYILDSYRQMQELAAAEESYETGKAAAKEVEEQYGERIAALADIDFDGLTESELMEYMSEFSTLTTAIREAKDALTLN